MTRRPQSARTGNASLCPSIRCGVLTEQDAASLRSSRTPIASFIRFVPRKLSLIRYERATSEENASVLAQR